MRQRREILLWAIFLVVLPVSLFAGLIELADRMERMYKHFLLMTQTLACFAANHGRMPYSFEEMIEKGYIAAEKVKETVRYRTYLVGCNERRPGEVLRWPEKLRVAWGLKASDLVLRNGRLYRRDDPRKEMFLLEQTDYLMRCLSGRDWMRSMNSALYEYMLLHCGESSGVASQPAETGPNSENRIVPHGTRPATSKPSRQ